MGDILIIRHGITAENTQSLLRGWDQVPLTPEGMEVVKNSAQRLKGVPVRIIFTSDLMRATQSAQIVQHFTQAPIKKLPALRAWNIGHLTGKGRAQNVRELIQYERSPQQTIPDGESFEQFVHRVGIAMGIIIELAQKMPQVIVVVAHNSVLTLVWEQLRGEKLTVHEERAGESQIVPPGGMVALTRGSSGWEAKRV
jgi:probable phosphoglycerate mutase